MHRILAMSEYLAFMSTMNRCREIQLPREEQAWIVHRVGHLRRIGWLIGEAFEKALEELKYWNIMSLRK
jgi:hypothetical protein